MLRLSRVLSVFLPLACLLPACGGVGDPVADAGVRDGATRDAGMPDGARADGGLPEDGAVPDAPGVDAPGADADIRLPDAAPLGAVYYVATDGNDANAGTIDAPWLSWQSSIMRLVAGDTLFIRGGTYHQSRSADTATQIGIDHLEGTEMQPISIFAYPGEIPLMDFSDVLHTSRPGVFGFVMQFCTYVHIRGLRFAGLAQNPSGTNAVEAFNVWSSNHITLELLEAYDMGGNAFSLIDSTDCLFLNCDAHHLGDPYTPGYAYGGSNGFTISAPTNESTRNTIRGCRVWQSSDNGYAFFNQDGTVLIEDSWAFWIGYVPGTFETGGDGVGFKLGPGNGDTTEVLRTLRNCLAFENRFIGFDENFRAENMHPLQLDHCTAYSNGLGTGRYRPGYNFAVNQSDRVNILRNNIAFLSMEEVAINPESLEVTNSWNGSVTVSAADFRSLSSVGMDGPRQADGSLPVLDFLRLAPASDLRHAGTDIDLPFSGPAPSMGAFDE